MSDYNDFVIENDKLIKYTGSDTVVEVPDGIAAIGDYAFGLTPGIEAVILPNTVKTIGVQAFYGCRELKELVCPPSVNSIGTGAFVDVKKITVYDNVMNYLRQAFHPDRTGKKYMSTLIIKSSWKEKVIDVVPVCFDGTSRTCSNMEAIFDCGSIDHKKQDAKFTNLKDRSHKLHIAFTRLIYPFSLSQSAKDVYLEYIGKNIMFCKDDIIADPVRLKIVLDNNLIDKTKVDDFADSVKKVGDSEMTAMITNYFNNNFDTSIDGYLDRMDTKIMQEEKKEHQKKDYDRKKEELEVIRKNKDADLKYVWTIKKNKSNNTCKLSNYVGNAEKIFIPSIYEGCYVTEISKTNKDTGYGSVRSITLPDTVVKISNNGFSYCKNLERIHLGSGLKEVGKSLFMGCEKLKEVVFPEGVKEITKWMLRDCKSLEAVVFESRDIIRYGEDCNFLRGANKAVVYVHKGTALKDFKIDPGRVVIIEDLEE